MLDNTKQWHQEVDFVENHFDELLIEVEVVVLLESKRSFFLRKQQKLCLIQFTICAVFNHCDHCWVIEFASCCG